MVIPGIARRYSVIFLCCGLLFAATGTAQVPVPPPVPQLAADTETATAGYFRLSWSAGPGTDSGAEATATPSSYELQEARDPEFRAPRTLYRGPDRARVMSGLDDGVRYYRVRPWQDGSAAGPWSATVRVEVAHHALGHALRFFLVGLVVFLGILFLILYGPRLAGREA